MSGHWLLSLLGIVVVAILTVPMLRRRSVAPPSVPQPAEGLSARVGDSLRTALAEIELDHAMGKLSDADYEALRSRYEQGVTPAAERAQLHSPGLVAAAPASPASPEAAMPDQDLDDLGEELVRRARAVRVGCPCCGPRPEPEARFCSSCGRFIRPCPQCGQPALQAGSRFCPRCGQGLA